MFVALGIPFFFLFFLAGFAWPAGAIPPVINALAQFVPSTPAISGFVRIGQMETTLSDVSVQLVNLWALVALYGSLAIGAGYPEAAERRAPLLAGREKAKHGNLSDSSYGRPPSLRTADGARISNKA